MVIAYREGVPYVSPDHQVRQPFDGDPILQTEERCDFEEGFSKVLLQKHMESNGLPDPRTFSISSLNPDERRVWVEYLYPLSQPHSSDGLPWMDLSLPQQGDYDGYHRHLMISRMLIDPIDPSLLPTISKEEAARVARVRPMHAGDIGSIVGFLPKWVIDKEGKPHLPDIRLYEGRMQHSTAEHQRYWEEHDMSFYHNILLNGRVTYYVVDVFGRGVMSMGIGDPDLHCIEHYGLSSDTSMMLFNVYCNPDMKGMGIASGFMYTLEQDLRQRGVCCVCAISTARNKENGGWKFYERNGFSCCGYQDPSDPSKCGKFYWKNLA